MTYAQICKRLTDAGIETAEWDTVMLMEHFCGVDPALARLAPHQPYISEALDRAVEARANRYPLQYLLGSWQFYRQTYTVTPDCLIPRSDTEILVEEAIRRLPEGARFLDLCTGSGCIAISVLAERPDTRATAVDKFPNTLALACQNALQNGVAERFSPLLGDVLQELTLPDGPPVDAILSNPPYVTHAELETLAPELRAEPIAALDGGEDGLTFYRAILANHAKRLSQEGFILFEIGCEQAAAVLALGVEHGFLDGRVIRDLGGNNRVVLLKRPTVEPFAT